MNNQKILADIKQNKVKEGSLLKQSRHIKQWKQRWMVLTKTYLYSFSTKGQYKDPTQCVNLKDVETFKSYFKDQYKKQYSFRIQSQDVRLHMSSKSSQQKIAWMTAIEKTIERLIHPNNQKQDSIAMVRETIRMAPAVRQTLAKKQANHKPYVDFSDDIIKKMKLNLDSQTIVHQVLPHIIQESLKLNQANLQPNLQSFKKIKSEKEPQENQQEETFFILEKKKPKEKIVEEKVSEPVQSAQKVFDLNVNDPIGLQKEVKSQQQVKIDQKLQDKNPEIDLEKGQQTKTSQQPQFQNQQQVHEKKTEDQLENKEQNNEQKLGQNQKIVQKIIYKTIQKIIKVPEIKEVFVQKIVYKENQSSNLLNVLKDLMANPGQNPTHLINFVVYLLTTDKQKYQTEVLQFCLDMQTRRFFSQIFLLMINQQIQEQNLNSYLKFVIRLYEACDDYFYTSDVKALITILIRQIEMNRSQLNQHLIMLVLESFTQKQWWSSLNYRLNEIKSYIKEIESISGEENKFLANRLLEKL